jgi:antitoxin component YwqK of YwqJK toxin-antitoxin module
MKKNMKSSNLFIVCLIVLNACSPTFAQLSKNMRDSLNRKQGLWHHVMTDGKKKYLSSVCYYENDKKTGQCDYFYSNGKIMSTNFYTNDTLNGVCHIYREDGTLFQIEPYQMGVLHGFKKYFDSNGVLNEEHEYKNGYLEGLYRVYYQSGKLAVESKITLDGKENGVRKVFKDSLNNELEKEFDFIDNIKIKARYFENGRIIKEEIFR